MAGMSLWYWLLVLIVLAVPVATVVAVLLFVSLHRRAGK